MTREPSQRTIPASVDAVIVGAGFAGLYAHFRLRQLGLSVLGFEAAPDVGGTWFWNRYPGARCDVESLDYSYSFDNELLEEWRWSERFATQPEILAYINHVADRFDLRREIAFETRVTRLRYDDRANLWEVETDRGDRVLARFVLATVGPLSLPKAPEFDGLEHFKGRWVQTGAWPREAVEISGKRIAVIGTGSSGIQAIPLLAREASHLTVFQRTANFAIPARNRPIDPEHEAEVRADYPAYCERKRTSNGGVHVKLATGKGVFDVSDAERQAAYEEAWRYGGFDMQHLFTDFLLNIDANETAAEFVRGKIREIVQDPEIAEQLSPRDHPLGTKRMCLETDYYATFNRPNVELVNLRRTPIERITSQGIKTTDKEHPFDLIVFATGFDAMSGPLLAMNIEGVGGTRLCDAWACGPSTYLGLMIAGFPNLFMVNGPGSPAVLSNMVATIEHHVEWIVDCIARLRDEGLDRMEAEIEAQDAWMDEVLTLADHTLFPLAKSWYMGDNVPGKPRRFMIYIGGFINYSARCKAVADGGYTGFRRSVSCEPMSAA